MFYYSVSSFSSVLIPGSPSLLVSIPLSPALCLVLALFPGICDSVITSDLGGEGGEGVLQHRAMLSGGSACERRPI